MKSHERMSLTPLEIAVWAAAYVDGGPTYPLEHADDAVMRLRTRLEAERLKEKLDEAKAIHQTRIVQSKRHGAEIPTVRCSCGYEPPPTDGYDAEEMMALHLAMVKAQGPEDIK